MPVVLASQEAETGRSLEPGKSRLQWAMIVPLHSSLGNTVRSCLLKKIKKRKRPGEMAHTCNTNTLGGQGRWITRSLTQSPGLSALALSQLTASTSSWDYRHMPPCPVKTIYRSSHLSLQSSWDHRHEHHTQLKFLYFCRYGFWDYRSEPSHLSRKMKYFGEGCEVVWRTWEAEAEESLAKRQRLRWGGLTMLVRLVLNSRPQAIRPPWPPKCLDYRRWSAVEPSQLTVTSAYRVQRQSLTLLLKLECSGTILAHCSLKLLSLSDPPASASQRWETHYVGQAGLKLLASASQSVGITDVSHSAQPGNFGITYVLVSQPSDYGVLLCRPGWGAAVVFSACCNLCLSGSSNSPASASQVAGITCAHIQLIFVFLVEKAAVVCWVTAVGEPPCPARVLKITYKSQHDLDPAYPTDILTLWSLTPSPRLECNTCLLGSSDCPASASGVARIAGWSTEVQSAHCNLRLLDSSNSCASASLVAGITGRKAPAPTDVTKEHHVPPLTTLPP
ncbi:hypothetical protein AAY473_014188 [Plecturocebus cupreus]